MTHDEAAALHARAKEAGDRAIVGMKDTGAVGFGYVRIIGDARSQTARAFKRLGFQNVNHGLFRGLHLSVNTGQQAYATNYAWAKAYADVLNEAGVSAIALCRAD